MPIDVDAERNRADLGSALRSLRAERGLTADRLAVRVHMSPAKFSGEVIFRDPRDVAIHQETFRRFEQLAVFGDSARAVLGTVGMQYRMADS